MADWFAGVELEIAETQRSVVDALGENKQRFAEIGQRLAGARTSVPHARTARHLG